MHAGPVAHPQPLTSLTSARRALGPVALVLSLAGLPLCGCRGPDLRVGAPAGAASAPARLDHDQLDRVLKARVSAEGVVDYPGLRAGRDRDDLRAYLGQAAAADPGKLSDAEKKVLWINLYNAATIEGVLLESPLESVQDAGGFFKRVKVNVGGADYSLDDIEHGILRKMGDPRIHMALVCASRSCPKLRNRAYRAADLDAALDGQARDFLADPARNRFDAAQGTAWLSSIFTWFGEDFDVAPHGGVRGFVRRYAPAAAALPEDFAIEFLAYDWSLNGPVAEKDPQAQKPGR